MVLVSPPPSPVSLRTCRDVKHLLLYQCVSGSCVIAGVAFLCVHSSIQIRLATRRCSVSCTANSIDVGCEVAPRILLYALLLHLLPFYPSSCSSCAKLQRTQRSTFSVARRGEDSRRDCVAHQYIFCYSFSSVLFVLLAGLRAFPRRSPHRQLLCGCAAAKPLLHNDTFFSHTLFLFYF